MCYKHMHIQRVRSNGKNMLSWQKSAEIQPILSDE